MRNLGFMLFVAIIFPCQAQDSKLFTYNWKLEKIITPTETFTAQPYPYYGDTGELEEIVFDEYNTYYYFYFGYYGNGHADDLIFNDIDSEFIIGYFTNHLGGMSPSENYFSYEFIIDDDFYLTLHNPFSYDFRYENGNIYLDIENNAGSIATFFDTFMNSKEFPKENIRIYPNPTSKTIHITGIKESVDRISVFDMTGKMVLNIDFPTSNTVNLESLKSGVYILKILTMTGSSIHKVFKN